MEKELEVRVDDLHLAAVSMENLEKHTGRLNTTLRETLRISSRADYWDTAARYGQNLADQLRLLGVRLRNLRYAVTDAAMPLAEWFVPALNRALLAMARFAKNARAVFGVLFGTRQSEAASLQVGKLAKQQEKLKKSIAGTGKAMKPYVAGFDEILRLTGKLGGGGVSGSGELRLPEFQEKVLSFRMRSFLRRLNAMLEPLRNLDFSGARLALDALAGSFRRLGTVVRTSLEWAWFHILVPLSQWTIQEAGPALIGMLASALDGLSGILRPVAQGFRELVSALEPVAGWLGDTVLMIFEKWTERFRSLAELMEEKAPAIVDAFRTVGEMLSGIWEKVEPTLTLLREQFSRLMDGLWNSALQGAGNILSAFSRLTELLTALFQGDFAGAWEIFKSVVRNAVQAAGGFLDTLGQKLDSAAVGITEKISSLFRKARNLIRGGINGVIGFINRMLTGIAAGMNGMVRSLNRLAFTVPDWIPGIGGKRFGMNLRYVEALQIPYLAQGAVLPPSRPFLAMVGDQKHGTNVEAPLEVIRQAVASVTGEQTSAILQGFSDSRQLQKQILEAVLGIELGDSVIGAAADRYRQNMAIVRGGI